KSGHLIFLDHATTGDGVVAALALLDVIVREERRPSELASLFQPVPPELVNVRVARKVPLEQLPDVTKLIDAVQQRLGDDGRVLVRYSGTEMKARVMVEGPDADGIRADAQAIADALVRSVEKGAVPA